MVFVCDPLSNVAYRFTQELDGQTLLAFKENGKWHMGGKVTVVAKNFLTNILFNLKTLFEVLDGEKFILRPLPRYLFKPCCEDTKHCEGMDQQGYGPELLQKSSTMRKQMKDILTATHTKITVPDILEKMFPQANSPSKLLVELEKISADDAVHLTDEGYESWADAILTCIREKVQKKTGEKASKTPAYFWRGFMSPTGLERPVNLAGHHAGRNAGGGKWPRGQSHSTRGRVGQGGRGGHGGRGGPRGRGRPFPYQKKNN